MLLITRHMWFLVYFWL